MKQHNCRVMTMLWLGANRRTCAVLVIFGIFVPCSLRSRKTAGWQRSGSQSLGPTVPSPHTWTLRSSMSDRSTTQWWTQRNLLALENTNSNKLTLQQHACQSWKTHAQMHKGTGFCWTQQHSNDFLARPVLPPASVLLDDGSNSPTHKCWAIFLPARWSQRTLKPIAFTSNTQQDLCKIRSLPFNVSFWCLLNLLICTYLKVVKLNVIHKCPNSTGKKILSGLLFWEIMFCPPFWHGGCLEKQECPRMSLGCSCHGKEEW